MNAWHLHNFVVIFPLFIVDTAHQLSQSEKRGTSIQCAVHLETQYAHCTYTLSATLVFGIDERYLKITLKTIANGFKVSRGNNEGNEHSAIYRCEEYV